MPLAAVVDGRVRVHCRADHAAALPDGVRHRVGGRRQSVVSQCELYQQSEQAGGGRGGQNRNVGQEGEDGQTQQQVQVLLDASEEEASPGGVGHISMPW